MINAVRAQFDDDLLLPVPLLRDMAAVALLGPITAAASARSGPTSEDARQRKRRGWSDGR